MDESVGAIGVKNPPRDLWPLQASLLVLDRSSIWISYDT